MYYRFMASLLLCFAVGIHANNAKKTTHLTLVIIIDQFAYNYLYKLQPFLTGGIKFLLKHGTVYENTYYQYAVPETAPGHATLQTGTLPKDHGIIANTWYADGALVEADDDTAQTARVFGPNNTQESYGKSAHLLVVDGISDQFMLQNQPESPHHVISLSLKSRASILTAGSLGKPIWFDKKNGIFTSSKTYFKTLPEWVQTFNNQMQHTLNQGCTWRLAYPDNNKAYNFYDTDTYSAGEINHSLINTTIQIDTNQKEPYATFDYTPCANQLLINLAHQCISHYCTKQSKTLLWLSLSSLDLLAHQVGPYAKESIDMIYHIDKQLLPLIQHAIRTVGKSNVLIALTADHGVMPMQGILQEHKLQHVYRYSLQEVISDLNKQIHDSFGIENLIVSYHAQTMYLNAAQFDTLPETQRDAIATEIKKALLAKPGIKNVWTTQELKAACFGPHQELESYYKNQLYPGRSGQIAIQQQPYTLLTPYEHGTSHETPYNYDTHVPLIIYEPKKARHKKIVQKVYTTQVAPTLAQLLHVPRPSASTAEVLPGLAY